MTKHRRSWLTGILQSISLGSSTAPPTELGGICPRHSRKRKASAGLRGGRATFGHFERLESREVLTVTFHGGQLLSNVEAQPVYLGSDWSTNQTLNSSTASIDTFVGYLVQSPYMDMLTQAGYNVGRGTSTAGKELNVNINKTTGITDAQIQTDLQSAISSGQLSAPDANRLYVVYVEPSVLITLGTDNSRTGFLGYHGAFAGNDATGKSADIRYAVMAYPGGPNPSAASQGFASSFNQLTSVTSHELAEAVTDPDVNYKAVGWYDDRRNGEIGDLTRQNSVLNGYLVQDVVNKNDQTIAPNSGSTSPGGSTQLSAPQNVAVTAQSSTTAQLTWNSVTGAAGYRIYLMNGSQSTLLGSVGASRISATITGLTAGTTESFRVEAFNSAGVADSAIVTVSLPSNAVTPPPQSQPPAAAPVATITAISSNAVQISWGSVAGALGYKIYWWNGTQAVLLGSVGASATSVRVTGLAAGSTSRFMVESFDGNGVADSAWVNVTTPASTLPWWMTGRWF